MRRNFWPLFFILFLIGAASLTGMTAETPKPYAKIMYATGTVQAFRRAMTEGHDAARGDDLFAGDRLTTGADSKAVLITVQRKMINLPANSELTVGQEQGQTIQGLGLGMFASGKGRSDIGAQATTRNSDRAPLLLYPRNTLIREKKIVLKFAPLEAGERYALEVVGVTPTFVYKSDSANLELPLDKDHAGNEPIPGQAYYIFIRKINANNAFISEEKDMRVGIIDPQQTAAVEGVEKEIRILMEAEKSNPAYLTLLAETYEANFLYHDAIQLYEKIFNEIAQGDAYSLARLQHLYALTKNSPALRALETKRSKN
ncbi:MAG: hypothetical protein AB1656_21975 [Candidatus Omnitrophota bacterium]